MMRISADTREAEALIAGMLKRLSDMRPAMKKAGGIITRSIRRNFDEGGRPRRWKPSIQAARKGRKTLVRSGRLRDSISARVFAKGVDVGSALPYAAIQQRGGGKVPPRPFLVVQDEDIRDIVSVVEDYLIGG